MNVSVEVIVKAGSRGLSLRSASSHHKDDMQCNTKGQTMSSVMKDLSDYRVI